MLANGSIHCRHRRRLFIHRDLEKLPTMSNPFSILSDSPPSVKPAAMPDRSQSSSDVYRDILEYVLLCTVDEQPTSALVFLPELASSLPEHWDKNLIDQALFERLRMTDASSSLLFPASTGSTRSTNRIDQSTITETRCLHYLAGCYQRLVRQRVSHRFIDDLRMSAFLSSGSLHDRTQ